MLDHCYFWKKDKIYKFFEIVVDFIEDSDEHANLLENNAESVIGVTGNWMDMIHELLLKGL